MLITRQRYGTHSFFLVLSSHCFSWPKLTCKNDMRCTIILAVVKTLMSTPLHYHLYDIQECIQEPKCYQLNGVICTHAVSGSARCSEWKLIIYFYIKYMCDCIIVGINQMQCLHSLGKSKFTKLSMSIFQFLFSCLYCL